MALASPGVQHQVEKLSRQIKRLVNSNLKEICRSEGLPVSGVKATLQNRILERLNEVNISGDTAILQRLENSVNNRGASPSGYQDYHQNRASSSAFSASSPTMPGQWANGGYAQSARAYAPLAFRTSPFYAFVEPLTKTVDLPGTFPHILGFRSALRKAPAMTSHRHTVATTLALNQDQAARIRSDPQLRICLFCGSDSGLGRYEQLDIAFPSQIEVKVNADEVKANYKGLKNKPGTTRPADITDFIRKTTNYDNAISITYALTQKDAKSQQANTSQKFTLIAYLVKTTSVGELTEKIKRRAVISKQKVLDEMITRANDPDIVATSSVMSLKDPISTLRIQIPCRSTVCSHNQCFDVASFLQLQEQAPTWTCPVCNKLISFEALVVDQYVQDILAHTSADQVTIEPNGNWSHGDSSTIQSSNGRNLQNDDSDDDLIDITDTRIYQVKKEEPPSASSHSMVAHTPPLTSRDSSSAPHSSSNKRKRQEVIDLTLSDEEDDEPPHRPSKRHAPGPPKPQNPASQSYYTPSPGLPDPRNGHAYPPARSSSSFSAHNHTTAPNNTPHARPPSSPYPPSPATRPNGVAPFPLRPPSTPQSHPPPPSSAFNPSLHLPPPNRHSTGLMGGGGPGGGNPRGLGSVGYGGHAR
ncbi:MAG: SUMO ligase siz1 [Bathelium mastoideum]|nr:MAG: SUMO ligase siz1 [Bathelium mastoideum]KAI9687589.1 MAG: SUMO ligase siz1 [Bathelium mastoideum]